MLAPSQKFRDRLTLCWRNLPEMSYERVQAETVAFGTKAADLPDRNRRNVGVMTKFFAAINVAEMNFNRRQINCRDRISQSNTGVRVSTRIN